ncbi:MAG TPA: HNH endonuclease [Nitrososphaera sp.]|jgi:hypothetical protein
MPGPKQKDFWSYVNKGEPDECWEFTGGKVGGTGYGKYRFNGWTERAHRVAWEKVIGPIPKGMLVLHRCDNPPCCNPAHLFLGTTADNVRDRTEKGRWKGGAPKKLTNEQEKEITELYSSGLTQREIANMFNVSQDTISRITMKGR